MIRKLRRILAQMGTAAACVSMLTFSLPQWSYATAISIDTTAADGMMYMIDVDPRALVSAAEDAVYCHLDIAPDAGATVTLCSVVALLEPRFAATTMLSAT